MSVDIRLSRHCTLVVLIIITSSSSFFLFEVVVVGGPLASSFSVHIGSVPGDVFGVCFHSSSDSTCNLLSRYRQHEPTKHYDFRKELRKRQNEES